MPLEKHVPMVSMAIFGAIALIPQVSGAMAPATRNTGPYAPLTVTMQIIQQKLNSIGRIYVGPGQSSSGSNGSHVLTGRFSNVPIAWSTGNHSFMGQISNVSADPDQCKVSYDWREERDGTPLGQGDHPWVTLGDVREVVIEPFDQYEAEMEPGSSATNVGSPFTAVIVKRANNALNVFPFVDARAASDAANAFVSAVQLCGGIAVIASRLSPATAPVTPSSYPQVAADNHTDYSAQLAALDQQKQDIADKIQDLQSDMDEQQSEAENWEQEAQQLGDTSNCTGLSTSICISIAQIGVNKAESNARKARQAAQRDQQQINELQGQSNGLDQQISNVPTTPSVQQPAYNPNAIVDAGNQQAAQIRAMAATKAAAASAAAGKPAGHNSKQCLDQNLKPIPGSENWKACGAY